MRQSKRFVLSTLIVICVFGGAVAIGTKAITARKGDVRFEKSISSEMVKNHYPYNDFESVEVEGAWKVEIQQSDIFSISIQAPSNVLKKTEIDKREGTLRLITDKWAAITAESITATITMPEIDRITSAGGSKVILTDFTSEKLTLDIEGACSITGKNNTIEHLDLEADGAVSVDFRSGTVTNAHIELAGAGSIELTMAGGDLSGEIEGVGSVTYYGEVKTESIIMKGLSSVKHKAE